MMKKILIGIVSIGIIGASILGYQQYQSRVLGDGNINTLDQFTSTTSPSSAITQRIYGKALRLTGLESKPCLGTDSNGIVGAGTCTGGSGGGTGNVSTSTTEQAGQLSYWTTTGGTPAKLGTVATTSLAVSAPITFSGTLGAQVGGVGGSFGCTSASSGVTGCLTGTDWNTFNGKESALTFNYPLSRSANTISFSGLGTTSPWTTGQLAYVVNGNTVASVGTSTLSATSPLTGSFVQVGSGGSLGCQTASGSQAGCLSSTDWTTFNNKAGFGYPFTVTTFVSTTTPIGFTQGLFSMSSTTLNGTKLTDLSQGWAYVGSNGLVQTSSTSTLANFILPFTSYGASTSTTLGLTGGMFSTASSTFGSALRLTSLSQGGLYVGSTGLVNTVATSTITASTGLTYSGTMGSMLGGSSGNLTVNTSQNITTLSNLTSNGVVYTAGGGGTLNVVSTSTPTVTSPITYSGTLGQFVGGVSGSFGCATCAVTETTITVAGTANQITSSAGAQDLSANRTWTLSFPNQVIFPQYASTTLGFSTPYASSTDLRVGLGQGFTYIGSNQKLNSIASSSINLADFNNNLANLTATDGSLTFSGSYNGSVARTVGLNLGNANTWTTLQTFNYSSTTQYASFLNASSTKWLGGGLATCSGTSFLQYTASGFFGCGVPAGSGDVSKVGTPLNDQVGVWTGDGTIEGDADLTFDGTKLTTVYASTTALSTSYASSTQYFGANLNTCNSASSALTWSGGVFGCNSITGSGAPAFDVTSYGGATTTTLGLLGGFFSTASSTLSGNVYLPALSQGILYTGSNGKVGTVATSSFALSGFTNDLANLTAGDSSLTFSGSYNGSTARNIVLNMGNANTWTALQTFGNSTTTYGSFTNASSTNLFLGTGQGALYTGSSQAVKAVATTTPTISTGLSYSGTWPAGLGGSAGNLTVNTSQNITTLSNLTSDGVVYTSGGAGTLNVDSGALDIARGGTNSTSFATNVLIGFDGTSMIATGTPQLTIGNLLATSTTATSTFAGGLAVQTSKFIVDRSTGFVGVGTTSPVKPFEVYGNTSGGVARIHRINASTNAILGTYDVLGESQGTITAGFGVAQTFSIQGVGGTINSVGTIAGVRENADNTGSLNLYATNGGTGLLGSGYGITISGQTGVTGFGTTTPGNDALLGSASTLEAGSVLQYNGLGMISASSSASTRVVGITRTFAPNAGVSGIPSMQWGTLTNHPVDIYINNLQSARFTPAGVFSFGTSTGAYTLTVASSTTSQLALSAGTGIAQWAFRNAGGNLYLATTTVAGTATSTQPSLSILNSGEFIVRGIFQFFNNLGTKIIDITGNIVTALGAWDFGGADSLEIPNGTGNTVDAVGEIAFDTTDNQFVIGTSTANATVALPLKQKLWSGTIASTSVDFISGGRIPLNSWSDGVIITEIRCAVDGGTSKAINLDTLAGGANTDSVTCGTSETADTAMSANYDITAGTVMSVELGATTGTVDYVTFSVWGYVKRE